MVRTFLVVGADACRCALPIEEVVETMRPLPVRRVAGVPPHVRGLSIVRGSPVPVVDLVSLMSGGEAGEVTRFVTLRANGRIVALAVSEVIGLRRLEMAPLTAASLDPREKAGPFESFGSLDGSILGVLRAGRIATGPAAAAGIAGGSLP